MDANDSNIKPNYFFQFPSKKCSKKMIKEKLIKKSELNFQYNQNNRNDCSK